MFQPNSYKVSSMKDQSTKVGINLQRGGHENQRQKSRKIPSDERNKDTKFWKQHNHKHNQKSNLPNTISNFQRQNNPGIFEPLSPKALYPRPPSQWKNGTSLFSKVNKFRLTNCSIMNTHGVDKTVSSSTNGGGSSSANSGNGIGGGSGGLGMDSGLFGGVGGGNVGKGPGNGNKNGGGRASEVYLEGFEYPDSPTSQKWLENPDLIPLTVLDNINLKTEFPYATNTNDIDKPPDINIISIDHLANADNLFQFTASIPPPVPDAASTNFLDLSGNDTDSFSQSLYDDLVDINLNEFPNVSSIPSSTLSTASVTSSISASFCPSIATIATNLNQTVSLPQSTTNLSAMIPTSSEVHTPSPAKITLPTKPLALDNLEQQSLATSTLISSLSRLKAELPPINISTQNSPQIQPKPTIDIGSLGLSLLPITAQAAVAALAQASNAPSLPPASVIPTSNIQNNHLPSVIKNLIEPLPASAVKDFIKVEPETMEENNPVAIQVPSTISATSIHSPQQIFTPTQCFNIKIENNNNIVHSTPFPISVSEPTTATLFTPFGLSGATCNIISNNGQILATTPNSPPSLSEHIASGNTVVGGKIKTSLTRKKSTCSTTSNTSTGTSNSMGSSVGTSINTITSNPPSSNDEEDISNIPSLQMRIQIISHRVSVLIITSIITLIITLIIKHRNINRPNGIDHQCNYYFICSLEFLLTCQSKS